MTVGELREKLAVAPDDATVTIANESGEGFREATCVYYGYKGDRIVDVSLADGLEGCFPSDGLNADE